jgi:hypothetical protein
MYDAAIYRTVVLHWPLTICISAPGVVEASIMIEFDNPAIAVTGKAK